MTPTAAALHGPETSPTRPTDRRSGRKVAKEALLPLRWTRPAAAVVMTLALAMYGYGHVAGRNTGPAFIVLSIALPIAHVLIKRVGEPETRFDLVGLLWLGLACKLLATYFRFLGGVDSVVYDQVGTTLAQSFRAGDFFAPTGRNIPGTGSIRYLTGVVHIFTNSSYISTFMLFSLLGFTGLVLCYRAFVIAVPDGMHRRYGLLVMLWPTLVFWPSSIGKEAVMVFGIGLACNGAARVLTRGRLGFLVFALGLLAMAMVRPHVALMLLAAMVIALLFRAPLGDNLTGSIAKFFGVALLLVTAMYLTRTTGEFLGLDDGSTSPAAIASQQSFNAALDQTEAQTGQGAAQFEAARVRSPVDYPYALVTVMFRPFFWEAHSPLALVSSAEGIVLMGLLAFGVGRMLTRIRSIRREAYVAFALSYVFTFCFLFAAIGNFGILTRQRSQVLPLVLVLAALPASVPEPRRSRRVRATS